MKEKQKEIKLVPDVLKALRETSGYSIEEVAKKLKAHKEKITSVEEGKDSFTLKQIHKLAEVYKYSLAAFFSDSSPKLPAVQDYRINREKKLTPQVYLAVRKAQYLSEKLKEISKKRSQIPSFPEQLNAEELAKTFRKFLKDKFNVESINSKKPEEILTSYKKNLEDNLTIIVVEYPLKADDVRAFSILSDVSVIVMNENDKPSIKLFSLFHEICHLLKRTAGICSLDIEPQNQDIENYCNRFAVEFLVPADDLESEVKNFGQIDNKAINQLTEIYAVSKQVMMIRLLWLNYMGKERYEEFKKEVEEGMKQKKQKKFGHRNWEKIYLNRIGQLVINEVKKSYIEEKITFYEASSVLDLKTKYAEKFIIP